MMEEIVIKNPDKKDIAKVKEADMKNREIEIWFCGRRYTLRITAKRVLILQ